MAKNPNEKELDLPSITDNEAQQSVADSSVPQKLSLNAIRGSLMDNKGRLQSTIYLSSISILQKMMLDGAEDTRQWLSNIVTLKEWNNKNLLQFLTDTRAGDTPDDDNTSLLRRSLPEFLDILLLLNDEIVAGLIHDLFTAKDKSQKTGIDQLIENRHFGELNAIFTRMRALPPLPGRPSFEGAFKEASTQNLMDFAEGKGSHADGYRFHQLVGNERLLQLSSAEMLGLITCLLTQSADSDGLKLYAWYKQNRAEEASQIAEDVFQEQRRRCKGSFSLDFIYMFLGNRPRTAQEFIKSLNSDELTSLVQPMVDTTINNHYYYAPMEPSVQLKIISIIRINPVVIGRNLIEKIQTNKPDMWIELLLKGSDELIPCILTHYNKEPTLHRAIGHAIMQPERSQAQRTALLMALDSQTRAAVLPFCHSSFVKNLSPGIVPFQDIRPFFYASRCSYNHDRNNVRYLQYTNGWNESANPARHLVDTLLDYRAERQENPYEHYGLFGIESGYSKTEKLAVVDKIFIHLYGTKEEKQESGSFSAREIRIMKQGNLGEVARRHSPLIQELIDQADAYKEENECSPLLYK